MKYRDRSFSELKKAVARNNRSFNKKLLKKAYDFASEVHKNKKRLSGKPFITHSLNTAYLLAEQKVELETVCAGLLHDVLDENRELEPELRKQFGKEVSGLVAELKKLNEIEKKNIGIVSGNELSRILLAVSEDVRTVLVNLAASLENMRNMEQVPIKKTRKLAKAYLDVYVPMAHKLGLYEIEWLLTDLSFKALNPKAYDKIKKSIKEKRTERERKIKKIIKDLKKILEKNKIDAGIEGRPKSFASIYKKIKKSNKKMKEINDLLGIRIICENVVDCYRALGLIHHRFDSTGHFDDYISHPKPNKYQSLHTAVQINGSVVEVQIRTWEMHRNAEEGVASHWHYKKFAKDRYFDKKLTWAKQLLEWQRKFQNSEKLLKSMRIDFGKKEIFVFTPKKMLVVLPESSVPLDFAYSVHTEIGHKYEKAIVNKKGVPIDHRLENGDTVEILTSNKTNTKSQWLGIVKSPKAKTKIRRKLGLRLSGIKKKEKDKKGIKTTQDKNVRLAECCNPLPGDQITGYKTTKRKIVVHRKNCEETKKLNLKNKIEIGWGNKKNQYFTKLRVNAFDRPGLLTDLLNNIAKNKAAIISTEARVSKNNAAVCTFNLEISNSQQLEKILEKLRKTDSVNEVLRI